ncbi:fibronectin type III domain-containing protein [Adlercreutzia equolifaciens]|uniref:fibronectin type III domain-containing protein n=1 Tax=Adlercreutzia equolifaciens TaxID=446660 RepID=UPI0023B196E9|nr:fibronectin type III domain-containing protein [Adlercreutzia equolifaciens]MDE8703299.1 fibronectin type III domain-containing protein [Adlercreutzia equolifaciens]
MTTIGKKTTSIALAALLSFALVPISAAATTSQAWGDETQDEKRVEQIAALEKAMEQSESESVSTLTDEESAIAASEMLGDAQNEIEALSLENAGDRKTITPLASYSDFRLQDGKAITYTTSSISDQILDFDFSLSAISYIRVSLNSYDRGNKYSDVSVFSLYNSNDEMLDIVYVDHNVTVKADWILPAGNYYIRYLSLNSGYKQTVRVGYSCIESGEAESQMVPSYLRSKDTAPFINMGEKDVFGVFFWGFSQTHDKKALDGHYYKIKITKKSPLEISFVTFGEGLIMLEDSQENVIGSATTQGTAEEPDATTFTTAALNPGTYYLTVLTTDWQALGNPFLFWVDYAKTSLSSASLSLSKSTATFTGSAIKPSVSVKLGGKTLKAGTDYTVSYKANTSVGTATVTVTGKGTYAGSKSATFKINPKGTSIKGSVKAGKKSLTVKWAKPSSANLKQTTGYQVRYATAKSMKDAKTKTVKASSSAGKKCSLTVSKLTGGKKYYVQVRTYKTVGGKNYYSAWSAAKTVNVKK